jgi:hypothetical protein
MTWADSTGASYLGWSWNPTGCASPALIRSWSGEPTVSGQRFREHLIALAHGSSHGTVLPDR